MRAATEATSRGRARDGIATTATGRRSQPQPLRTSTTALTTRAGASASGSPGREQLPQPGAPADVGQPGHRPPGLGTLAGGDPALDGDAERGHAGRPHRARLELDARPVDRRPGRRTGGLGHRRSGTTARRTRRSARTARPTGRRARGGATPSGTAAGDVAAHRLLLVGPGLRAPGRSARGRTPTASGGLPAALHAPDGAVDVEHLEHHLQPGAAQRHPRLQRRRRQRPPGLGEHAERPRTTSSSGNASEPK